MGKTIMMIAMILQREAECVRRGGGYESKFPTLIVVPRSPSAAQRILCDRPREMTSSGGFRIMFIRSSPEKRSRPLRTLRSLLSVQWDPPGLSACLSDRCC